MNTITVTLGDLVQRTLYELEAATEVGRLVTLGSNMTTADVNFTLTNDTVANVSDILEFGSEVMLVTAKSGDLNPTYTVARGYYGTTKAAHSSQDVGYTNPAWPRHRVAEGVRRSFARLEAMGLPLVKSKILFPVEAVDEPRLVIELPSEARNVWSVRKGLREVDRWEFVDTLPSQVYPTGRVVTLPRSSATMTDELWVTYQTPYRWSTFPDPPGLDATIEIPEGAEDVPCSYAAAWLCSAREVSRMDLDRSVEFSQSEPVRGGVSAGLVRARWQEFYRLLDEARRLDPPIPRRPYIRRRS